MDRRKSIKALLIGGVSAGALIEACQPADKKAEETKILWKNTTQLNPAHQQKFSNKI